MCLFSWRRAILKRRKTWLQSRDTSGVSKNSCSKSVTNSWTLLLNLPNRCQFLPCDCIQCNALYCCRNSVRPSVSDACIVTKRNNCLSISQNHTKQEYLQSFTATGVTGNCTLSPEIFAENGTPPVQNALISTMSWKYTVNQKNTPKCFF